jgi:hypothetical protein
MQVFLIHRFASRKAALSRLKSIAKKESVVLEPVVLDCSGGDAWKPNALARMDECEAVAVYDMAACMESKNAAWEIEQAQEMGKPLISLDPKVANRDAIERLTGLYHYNEEFNSYFKGGAAHTEALYKMMVDSSELLIQRRQRMNAFFITAIGSLLAIAGALAEFGPETSPALSSPVVAAFGIVGLFLCNSWRNLIDNYGKLNTAKFRVILKLEESLSAQIFAAEWTALGKGRRPQKYKSFTSTENKVPLWFAILIFGLLVSVLAIGYFPPRPALAPKPSPPSSAMAQPKTPASKPAPSPAGTGHKKPTQVKEYRVGSNVPCYVRCVAVHVVKRAKVLGDCIDSAESLEKTRMV